MNHELQTIENTLAPARSADQNPAAVYLASLSTGSRRTILGALNKIADLAKPGMTAENFPWHEWEYQHSQAIRSKLIDDGYAPRYVNKILAALKGVLKECWRLGLMDVETYQRAIDIKGAAGSSLPAGRYIPELEFDRLFETTTRDLAAINVRDAAILATLYRAGLRRSEIAALDVADYKPTVLDATGEVTGVFSIRNTKRNKDRFVPIANEQREAVNTWLEIRGDVAGALFLPINKSGKMRDGGRLTPQSVYDVLATRRDQAQDVEPLTPHDFRRTVITDMEAKGIPLSTIADYVGHSDIRQTEAYTQKLDRARAAAAASLNMKYRRPDGA